MCIVEINKLDDNKLITKSNELCSSIEATTYGHLMARYYLSIDTMQQFRKVFSFFACCANIKSNCPYKIIGTMRLADLFHILTCCSEFTQSFPLRNSDKATLNALNKSQSLRFPIKGNIRNISQKTSW